MARNLTDPTRHLKVFSPAAFGETAVHVVGCGATGSRIALSLAKLGVMNLHIWDFDHVEAHNIANQAFGLSDVGKPKVEALAQLIKHQTGLDVTVHPKAVDGRTKLDGLVFLLTDTMNSRKEIWEGCIRYKPGVKLMIGTRMGLDGLRVYTVNPLRPQECAFWERSWYPDEQATESLCGARTTVGPTAEIVSGIACWQFIRWFGAVNNPGQPDPATELLFELGGLYELNTPTL